MFYMGLRWAKKRKTFVYKNMYIYIYITRVHNFFHGQYFLEWCSCWTYVYGMSLNATTHLSVFDSNPPL